MKTSEKKKELSVLVSTIAVMIFVIIIADFYYGISWLPILEINLAGHSLNVIAGAIFIITHVKKKK